MKYSLRTWTLWTLGLGLMCLLLAGVFLGPPLLKTIATIIVLFASFLFRQWQCRMFGDGRERDRQVIVELDKRLREKREAQKDRQP
jgi:hypothetical protein